MHPSDSPTRPPASTKTPPARLGSMVLDWAERTVLPTDRGERRDFFDGPTATLTNFECHATTLNPGETPHEAHAHPDEEMIVVKDGTVEVTINGRVRCAGAGSVFFFASGDLHGLKNPGTTTASYHVFRFITATTPGGNA